jgi:hypothetical protein
MRAKNQEGCQAGNPGQFEEFEDLEQRGERIFA